MAQFRHPTTDDVATVSDDLVDYMQARGWRRVITEDEAADLKGANLDQALEDSGLPKSGTADEKRARLAHTTTTKEN